MFKFSLELSVFTSKTPTVCGLGLVSQGILTLQRGMSNTGLQDSSQEIAPHITAACNGCAKPGGGCGMYGRNVPLESSAAQLWGALLLSEPQLPICKMEIVSELQLPICKMGMFPHRAV